VWLTEHHVCDDGHAPSILPLAAAVATTTRNIRIGIGVLLLQLYHPVRVAEDCATIDILSNGRFEFDIGIGYRPQEFSGLGVSRSGRATRIDEGVEIIRRLWEGETLTFAGKHYQLDPVQFRPPPIQRTRPSLWVGGFAPAAARRVARVGDGYIGTGDMTEQSRVYREAWSELGRSDKHRCAGGHFWLMVSRDPVRTFAPVAPTCAIK
jgi:alkanesulfonate monooxygenase SsuD/methylene tetrahydromethanopterin reductase-like flavin-dependent oxidoreductase (luciferase family)